MVEPRRAIFNQYAYLDKMLSPLSKYNFMSKVIQDILDLIKDNIETHKTTLDKNDPRDFIDMALCEIENVEDKKSSFYGEVGEDNLKVTLLDLFLAGSETTATTLTWAALYMVRYLENQVYLCHLFVLLQ